MSLPSFSLTGVAAHSQDPDCDVKRHSEPTSSTQPMEEEGELSDQESTKPKQDLDQEVSEELTYRETVIGVRSFIGWKQVPELESSSSSLHGNPFAGARHSQPARSLKLPSDEWLCKKMQKLNVTVTEGYPCGTSVLSRDQFIKTPKTLKWYGMFVVKQDFSRSKVHCWTNEQARLNSYFCRVARQSLPSAPSSRPIHQDTLRRLEKLARDQSYMCNQAAGLKPCLFLCESPSIKLPLRLELAVLLDTTF